MIPTLPKDIATVADVTGCLGLLRDDMASIPLVVARATEAQTPLGFPRGSQKMKALEVQSSPLSQRGLSRTFSTGLEPATSAQKRHPGSDLSSSCLFSVILAEVSSPKTLEPTSPQGPFSE